MSTSLTGLSFLGFSRGRKGGVTFAAVNPATGAALEPAFHTAHADEVEAAAKLAATAAPVLAALPGKAKAAFLRDLASRIEAALPALVARAQLETGLPEARCQGETGRTVGQLRLFADLVDKGEWVDARIETANPDRKPVPKPDHRSMCRALGPVAVFCASNFPFAYSVAGGDTASALAAGCPVVVVAHPAHPGTAEIMGGLVVDAVRAATEAVARATGRDVGAFNSNFMDRSPFMGLMNPLAPPMEARLDRDHGEHGAVIGTVTFREPHEGPPGHVHGGFLAAVFDEVLGQAQSLSGRPGMTGKLSISYRSPTPLFRELTVRGWIDRIDGRKIFTRGTLHDGDTLCCESEGLFISMPTNLLHLLRKGRDTVDSTVPPEFRSRMAGENSQQ